MSTGIGGTSSSTNYSANTPDDDFAGFADSLANAISDPDFTPGSAIQPQQDGMDSSGAFSPSFVERETINISTSGIRTADGDTSTGVDIFSPETSVTSTDTGVITANSSPLKSSTIGGEANIASADAVSPQATVIYGEANDAPDAKLANEKIYADNIGQPFDAASSAVGDGITGTDIPDTPADSSADQLFQNLRGQSALFADTNPEMEQHLADEQSSVAKFFGMSSDADRPAPRKQKKSDDIPSISANPLAFYVPQQIIHQPNAAPFLSRLLSSSGISTANAPLQRSDAVSGITSPQDTSDRNRNFANPGQQLAFSQAGAKEIEIAPVRAAQFSGALNARSDLTASVIDARQANSANSAQQQPRDGGDQGSQGQQQGRNSQEQGQQEQPSNPFQQFIQANSETLNS